MGIPEGHVCIARARSRMEAQLLQGLLASQGLHVIVPGESLLDEWAMAQESMNCLSCDVYVPEAEATAATEILATARASALEDPASRPVRFGVVGAGRIVSGRFIPALHACADATLQVVATREPARARTLGAERVTTRYDDVFEDPSIDAVYIGTHNGLHHEHALAALRHGKHVLCEKPLGRNAAECREVFEAAQNAGVLLIEAFMYRSHPQIALLRQLLAQGAIGSVRSVEASFSFLLTKNDDVRLVPEWGGGALLDVGCYCVNFSRMILGDSPRRVCAVAGFDPHFGVDTSLSALLDYGDGRHALLACGFDGGLRNRALINGTEGVLELPDAFLTFPDKGTRVLLHRNGATETHEIQAADSFSLMLASFVAAARGLAETHLAPDEGWKNARIMDALLHSARSAGNTQALDPFPERV